MKNTKINIVTCPKHGSIYNRCYIKYKIAHKASYLIAGFCVFCKCFYVSTQENATHYHILIDGIEAKLSKSVLLTKNQIPDSYRKKLSKEIITGNITTNARKGTSSTVVNISLPHKKKQIMFSKLSDINVTEKENALINTNDINDRLSETGLFECSEYDIRKKEHNLDICPSCFSVLNELLCNVPMYDLNNEFHALQKADIMYCYRCKRGYMTDEEMDNLLVKNNGMEQKYTFHPRNVVIKNTPDTNIYDFAPIVEFNMHIPYSTDIKNASDGYFDQLNPESFLKKRGYAPRLNERKRRDILLDAVSIYGARRVISFIRWDKNLHPYSKPSTISAWDNDIEFLIKVCKP